MNPWNQFASALFFCASAGTLPAVTLVEIDFSGTGPNTVGTILSSDSQFTIKDPAVIFTGSNLAAVGGNLSTASWVYDGTGTAAANIDLHTATSFGNPTRFDLQLGLAASGQSYTITSVELDIRAAGTEATWQFGYRDFATNDTFQLGTQTISTQGGANPITTYSIDLTSENLTATDSSSTWKLGTDGKLRWLFSEGTATGNDNFQVAAIRVKGTVVPEPGSVVLLTLGALSLGFRRRRC